ncbi:unnamed protein product (macronuclear) [Paramecium tetraurelia]|uniref:Next to BRCA1 central domain-containing protein n=1 Tax=Paramecium tetraurelia TaxID=5888 RepID=A0BVX3_PARTE|nr:uncharacterized protein GSPATT00032542001 [Paramecium tetraurelia]CAK62690.1 unnamed protein product [Paramecium tetraurelia]|eukprot:XP_001430088.1 hypothetical protein (macronuclear) [Paramecium tetraurelia strain d4-2]
MSNIKYIYLKKIHKVPFTVNSYYSLVETIKMTYKQLKDIYLFAIINSQNGEAVWEINSDVTFQSLKSTSQQQGLSSIKILVTENQNYQEVLKDSWNLLNQSTVATEKKSQDASTYFQPSNQDQCQQSAPQLGNIGTQAKAQQIDNASNTNTIDYRNNQQLKELIDEIIDQKLKELGLIKSNDDKIDPSDYKFSLTKKNTKYTANIDSDLKVSLCFNNNGNKKWFNPYLTNTGIRLHQKFSDLAPGEYTQVIVSIPYIPNHFQGNPQYTYRFKIYAENEKGQLCEVYGEIPIIVKAPENIQLSPEEQKISKLQSIFPQIGKQQIVKFVQQQNQDKPIDQLIEEFLQ